MNSSAQLLSNGLYVLTRYVIARCVSLDQLISSQPIQALERPSFQNMIGIAARAENGLVKFPNCRQARQAIINAFKEQLTALRNKLQVWYTVTSLSSGSSLNVHGVE
jgi:hypothetical protein